MQSFAIFALCGLFQAASAILPTSNYQTTYVTKVEIGVRLSCQAGMITGLVQAGKDADPQTDEDFKQFDYILQRRNLRSQQDARELNCSWCHSNCPHTHECADHFPWCESCGYRRGLDEGNDEVENMEVESNRELMNSASAECINAADLYKRNLINQLPTQDGNAAELVAQYCKPTCMKNYTPVTYDSYLSSHLH